VKRFFLFSLGLVLVVALVHGPAAPEDVNTLIANGIDLSEKGRFDQALAAFNRALQIKPQDPMLYNYRGKVYWAKGQNDKALADFTQALTMDPKNGRAYEYRALVYCSLEDFAKALADVDKAKSLGFKIDEDFYEMLKSKAAAKK